MGKKMLELFAGTSSVGNVFKEHGWEVYTVDWDEQFDVSLHADIGSLTVEDIITLCGGVPDVIWASPDCTTYSVMAISHHRFREENGNLRARTEYAQRCDTINEHVVGLIKDLNPRYWFIENPVGGMRKMGFMAGLPRYTVTYCMYGETRQKPTDIWTNHPDPKFRPACKRGSPCHEAAPRGSKCGTQKIDGKRDRARIPRLLCEHIYEICQE